MLTEAALQHRVISGIAEITREGLPVAATDNGNEWLDGFCWLCCGQRWTRDLWSSASVAGAQASMYACGPYIRALQERVWQSLLSRDETARANRPNETTAAGPRSARRTGRHRGQSRFLRRG